MKRHWVFLSVLCLWWIVATHEVDAVPTRRPTFTRKKSRPPPLPPASPLQPPPEPEPEPQPEPEPSSDILGDLEKDMIKKDEARKNSFGNADGHRPSLLTWQLHTNVPVRAIRDSQLMQKKKVQPPTDAQLGQRMRDRQDLRAAELTEKDETFARAMYDTISIDWANPLCRKFQDYLETHTDDSLANLFRVYLETTEEASTIYCSRSRASRKHLQATAGMEAMASAFGLGIGEIVNIMKSEVLLRFNDARLVYGVFGLAKETKEALMALSEAPFKLWVKDHLALHSSSASLDSSHLPVPIATDIAIKEAQARRLDDVVKQLLHSLSATNNDEMVGAIEANEEQSEPAGEEEGDRAEHVEFAGGPALTESETIPEENLSGSTEDLTVRTDHLVLDQHTSPPKPSSTTTTTQEAGEAVEAVSPAASTRSGKKVRFAGFEDEKMDPMNQEADGTTAEEPELFPLDITPFEDDVPMNVEQSGTEEKTQTTADGMNQITVQKLDDFLAEYDMPDDDTKGSENFHEAFEPEDAEVSPTVHRQPRSIRPTDRDGKRPMLSPTLGSPPAKGIVRHVYDLAFSPDRSKGWGK